MCYMMRRWRRKLWWALRGWKPCGRGAHGEEMGSTEHTRNTWWNTWRSRRCRRQWLEFAATATDDSIATVSITGCEAGYGFHVCLSKGLGKKRWNFLKGMTLVTFVTFGVVTLGALIQGFPFVVGEVLLGQEHLLDSPLPTPWAPHRDGVAAQFHWGRGQIKIRNPNRMFCDPKVIKKWS